MKAAILRSKIKNENYLSFDKKVSKLITNHGFDLDKSFLETSVEEDSDELFEFYEKTQQIIKQADFFISEVTEYSVGIGYLIANIVSSRKPILCLHNKDSKNYVSNIIKSGSKSKLMDFYEYDMDSLENIVNKYLRKIDRGVFIKRIPIEFTAKQVDYINFRKKQPLSGKSINSIVREIIDEALTTDRSYTESQ